MEDPVDNEFYSRADEHIHLSNAQVEKIGRCKVSASMMFATARFNAWITACGHDNSEGMKAAREETIEYFIREYRAMLSENLDDYIAKFDDYMNSSSD